MTANPPLCFKGIMSHLNSLKMNWGPVAFLFIILFELNALAIPSDGEEAKLKRCQNSLEQISANKKVTNYSASDLRILAAIAKAKALTGDWGDDDIKPTTKAPAYNANDRKLLAALAQAKAVGRDPDEDLKRTERLQAIRNSDAYAGDKNAVRLRELKKSWSDKDWMPNETSTQEKMDFISWAKNKWAHLKNKRLYSDYVYDDNYLPKDFGNNVLDSFMNFPIGTLIKIFTLEDRFTPGEIKRGYKRDSSTGLLMTPNGEYENGLLAKSRPNGRAFEVAHARLFDRNGRMIKSAPFVLKGNANEIGINDMIQLTNALVPYGNAYLLEITHTHPSYEFSGSNEKNGMIETHARTSPLSGWDYDALFKIGYSGILVRMRAVVPNGYTYQDTFSGTHRVSDPFTVDP
jgi:hypothetical protein